MECQIGADVCVICRLGVNTADSRSVKQKGKETLLHYCELRADYALNEYLLNGSSDIHVHDLCYRTYTSKRRYEQQAGGGSSSDDVGHAKLLRSSVNSFSFKLNCFLCGQLIVVDSRHPDRSQVSKVCTTGMHESVLALCKQIIGTVVVHSLKLELAMSLTRPMAVCHIKKRIVRCIVCLTVYVIC
jgi:hypothetical protein